MQESWHDLAKVAVAFVCFMILVIQWHWNRMLIEQVKELNDKIKKLEGGIPHRRPV